MKWGFVMMDIRLQIMAIYHYKPPFHPNIHLTISNTQHPSLDNLALLHSSTVAVTNQPEAVPLAFLESL